MFFATLSSAVSSSDGHVTADDYTATSGQTITLSFVSTRITGSVTANDYSVDVSDPVTLEFTP